LASYQVVGKATPRVESLQKVTGSARYTADFVLPGTIWGKTLHSAYAHARIVSIDTSAARELPGVLAVLTGADVSAGMYGRAIKDIPVLAIDRVRFAGERVVAVAAEDEDIAQRALDLIDVEYEELPAVFTVAQALAADAPILHPAFAAYTGGAAVDPPSNAYSHTRTARGDLDAGFSEADIVLENTYETPRVHHAYLEPQAALVAIEGEDVNVWTVSKAPYATRGALADAIGVPPERIIFHHGYIGGDFGGKATPGDLPIAYYLAKATGRPVRMVMDYSEEFMAANPRHGTVVRLRTGLKRDGTITAHHAQFFVNCGAYAGYKPGRVIGGAAQAAGPYRVPNTLVESIHVYSNLVPGGHMRAPGYPQATFALESHIDELARAVGMDPLAFRLKNLIDEGDETASGLHLQHVRAKETLLAACQAAGYDTPKPPNVGRGMAIGDHAPGGGQGTAELKLLPDGTVVLRTPIFDQGTGTYTTLSQIVAEELGVPLKNVSIEVWDTGALDTDSGIGGSRGTRVATLVGHAVAGDARAALIELAAGHLGWPAEEISLEGSRIHRAGFDETLPWPALLTRAETEIVVRSSAQAGGPATLTSFVAQVAEVSVDTETGEVNVLHFTTAHDVGRVMNPIGHQGQINGGFAMGYGFAVSEELQIDKGSVTTLSFGDYKIPTACDLPPLTTVLVESDEGVGPYQARGIGESPIVPVAPAIANAIADAVGVRLRRVPLTAEDIHRHLNSENYAEGNTFTVSVPAS
jgi:CO/xanthine dehydrogenase Mo-binding subunit